MHQTTKEKVKVVVYTDEWRVEGDLHILATSRLTDALNSPGKDFLAMTDATVYDSRTGAEVTRTKFLDVNRTKIAVVYTVD